MLIDECYQLGYIAKSHGLKGEVVAILECDNPYYYENLESVFLEKSGNLVPFFISSMHINADKAIIAFEGIDNVNSASEIVGFGMFLPLSFLPQLEKDQYYFHELIGYRFFNEDQFLGLVVAIYQPSSQILVAVDYNGNEVLVPMEDEIIKRVDKVERVIKAVLPDGLLEIYIDPTP